MPKGTAMCVERRQSRKRVEPNNRLHEIKRKPERLFIAARGDQARMRDIGVRECLEDASLSAHGLVAFGSRTSRRTSQDEVTTSLGNPEDDILTTATEPGDIRYGAGGQPALADPIAQAGNIDEPLDGLRAHLGIVRHRSLPPSTTMVWPTT